MRRLLRSFLMAFCLFTVAAWGQCPPDIGKFVSQRSKMVKRQIEKRGVRDSAVLTAMRTIPRHCFVPSDLQSKAYDDTPLPIGEGQTISQPYIVALMTASLKLKGNETVLEIGTGSGYQAAVLSKVVGKVVSIEIKEKLYQQATRRLAEMNFTNIATRHGDGYFGWEDEAPYDCIMITAAVDHIPPPLLKQLKPGGRLILPLGNPFSYQNLVLVTKKGEDYTVEGITGVLFVPMTGQAVRGKASQ